MTVSVFSALPMGHVGADSWTSSALGHKDHTSDVVERKASSRDPLGPSRKCEVYVNTDANKGIYG